MKTPVIIICSAIALSGMMGGIGYLYSTKSPKPKRYADVCILTVDNKYRTFLVDSDTLHCPGEMFRIWTELIPKSK